ncbi:integral membrane [Diplodia corticola]|uniref:Integral membrane n=1 Tax=Diplodia corticola TaxID=236234 RepID=A0A1J9SJZ7_9PEZI|nr:integral membrane [Diplodia corticola]OJD40671.1 integral membrane [Diplodia corticola]
MSSWATPTNETLYGEARQNAIDNAGIVSRKAFEVNIGLFTGLAVITVVVRFIIRLQYMRRLLLDDCFLLFAAACLVTSMAVVYWYTSELYLVEALNTIPTKVIVLTDEVLPLLDSNKKIQIFLGTNWSAIFAVKFSFLAYFKALVWNISPRLKTYFWFVVTFTGLSWAFLVSEGFILCPYFGMEGVKCMPNTPRVLNISLTSTVTILDVVTDILVVTFPIIIIHRAHMSRRQKIGLGTFLSLSLVMVIIAMVRIVGSVRGDGANLDVAWEFFWQQLEACVAVMMGSVTAFRGVFSRGDDRSGASPGPGESRDALVRRRPSRRWWWRRGSTGKPGARLDEESGTVDSPLSQQSVEPKHYGGNAEQ